MVVVFFLLIIIIFGFMGLMTWASSELPLALKEVAMNTRKEAGGKEYKLISIYSLLIKIAAVIVWVVGLIAAIAVIAGGPQMMGNLFW